MRRSYFHWLVSVLGMLGKLYGEIHEVNNVHDIKPYVQNLNQQDLAVFDVDMVLIQPVASEFQMRNMNAHKQIMKQIMQEFEKNERDFFINLMVTTGKTMLIDEEMLTILQDLKNQQVPSIGLTALLTGALESVSSLEEWRIHDLERLGIDFSTMNKVQGPFVFKSFPPCRRGYYPVFKQGVLFSNGSINRKGVLLQRFLTEIAYEPKRILFIDDSLDNLKDIEQTFQAQSGVKIIGLHYTGAAEFPSSKVDEETFWRKYQDLAEHVKKLP